MAQVAIVMGSNSDLPVVQGAIQKLKEFGVGYEAHVISAHRTPYQAEEFAKNAKEKGVKVIIAAAGKAAHLGGVIAGLYHASCDCPSHPDLSDGRFGFPLVYGADAIGHSGSHCGSKRRRKRGNPGGADVSPL